MYVEYNIRPCSLHLQREAILSYSDKNDACDSDYIRSHINASHHYQNLILLPYCTLLEQAFNECNGAQNYNSKYSERYWASRCGAVCKLDYAGSDTISEYMYGE